MAEIKKQYDPVILDHIKRFLENEVERGKARYYDISVDGLKVLERTSDPKQFDLHEEHINDMTERVVINIYTSSPTSPHIPTRYILSLKEEPKPQVQTLNGFSLGEVEARINEKVSQERERWDCDQVKRELIASKEKLKEAEEYAEQLAEKLEKAQEDAKSAKTVGDFTNILKDLALPVLLGNKTAAQTLAGNDKPEEEANFKMKTEESSTLSDQDKGYIKFGQFIQSNFSEKEVGLVVRITESFATKKENLQTVAALLNINQEKTENTK